MSHRKQGLKWHDSSKCQLHISVHTVYWVMFCMWAEPWCDGACPWLNCTDITVSWVCIIRVKCTTVSYICSSATGTTAAILQLLKIPCIILFKLYIFSWYSLLCEDSVCPLNFKHTFDLLLILIFLWCTLFAAEMGLFPSGIINALIVKDIEHEELFLNMKRIWHFRAIL